MKLPFIGSKKKKASVSDDLDSDDLDEAEDVPETPKKKGFFGRLFSRKKEDDDEDEDDDSDFSEDGDGVVAFDPTDLDDEVEKVLGEEIAADKGGATEAEGAADADADADGGADAGDGDAEEDVDDRADDPFANEADDDMPDFGAEIGGVDSDFEDDDDEEGGGSAKKKRIAILASVAVLVLGLIGGGAWWLLAAGGDPGEATNGAHGDGPAEESEVPVVTLKVPPRKGGMLVSSNGKSLNAIGSSEQRAPGEGVIIPAYLLASYSGLSEATVDHALSKVPDPTLVEQSPDGPLPHVEKDSKRTPLLVYARPFDIKEVRPRIAIIIRDIGLSRAASDAAIRGLPSEVTMAFNPYAPGLEEWVNAARERGHESLMMVPMEPQGFPVSDPGPRALMTNVTPEENKARLHYVLSRATGYVGVLSHMGSALSINEEFVLPLLQSLKTRGLLFVDGGSQLATLIPKLASKNAVPRVFTNIILDEVMTRDAIDKKLAELDDIAREQASAVAVIGPHPAALARLSVWMKTLPSKQFVLAPVSALADRQFLP